MLISKFYVRFLIILVILVNYYMVFLYRIANFMFCGLLIFRFGELDRGRLALSFLLYQRLFRGLVILVRTLILQCIVLFWYLQFGFLGRFFKLLVFQIHIVVLFQVRILNLRIGFRIFFFHHTCLLIICFFFFLSNFFFLFYFIFPSFSFFFFFLLDFFTLFLLCFFVQVFYFLLFFLDFLLLVII